MYQRMRLWWQQPTDEELEWACAEERQQEHDEIVKKHKGNCPICGGELIVGVSDYTVGRSCSSECGYHDFRYLYPEID